jgi:hypothetical protein
MGKKKMPRKCAVLKDGGGWFRPQSRNEIQRLEKPQKTALLYQVTNGMGLAGLQATSPLALLKLSRIIIIQPHSFNILHGADTPISETDCWICFGVLTGCQRAREGTPA